MKLMRGVYLDRKREVHSEGTSLEVSDLVAIAE